MNNTVSASPAHTPSVQKSDTESSTIARIYHPEPLPAGFLTISDCRHQAEECVRSLCTTAKLTKMADAYNNYIREKQQERRRSQYSVMMTIVSTKHSSC